MWTILFKYWKYIAGAAIVVVLFFVHQGMVRRHYNEAFNRGYTVARDEGKAALAAADKANRDKEKDNDAVVSDYGTALADRNAQRTEQDRKITEIIMPKIEAQGECKIDPAIIDGINSIRSQP